MLILKNAHVIRNNGVLEGPEDIVIERGIIQKVVRSYCESEAPHETVDCTGLYVSPGLVNLHTHSPMSLFRGIAEDVNIEDWFNVKIWPYESRLTSSDVRVGAMLDIYEMIDSGVTAFFDHYFFSQEIVRAAREAGIRADIAPTIFGLAPDWRKSLMDALSIIESVNGTSDTVKMRLGPHAPYTCPPEVLAECVKEAKRLGLGIHIHVAETQKQVEDSLLTYGKTPFKVLYDAGVMEVSCLLAHGIFIQESDLALINENCFFALAPKTYMKLSSGMGNIFEFIMPSCPEKGRILNSGVATDGAASSNTQGLIEQVRLLALLGKMLSQDASSFDVKRMWALLMNGHRFLNQNTGDVAPGYDADLVAWDLSLPHTWPVYDPLASIIYSSDNRNVKHVLVAGRFLKRDGNVQVFDVKSLLRDVENVRKRLIQEGAGKPVVKY